MNARDTRTAAPSMTHQHFRFIAQVLAESAPAPGYAGARLHWNGTVARFADALAATNPRFDRERFLAAVRGQAGGSA